MKSFQMNLKKGARSNFELFGISQERCKELCGLVDEIEREHEDWDITQVLEEASKHSQNENENRFLIATYFQDHGVQHGVAMGKMMGDLHGLFERLVSHNEEGYSIRRPHKHQMN